MSGTDLWRRRLDAAHIDLTTALRRAAASFTGEAVRLEKGVVPALAAQASS